MVLKNKLILLLFFLLLAESSKQNHNAEAKEKKMAVPVAWIESVVSQAAQESIQ